MCIYLQKRTSNLLLFERTSPSATKIRIKENKHTIYSNIGIRDLYCPTTCTCVTPLFCAFICQKCAVCDGGICDCIEPEGPSPMTRGDVFESAICYVDGCYSACSYCTIILYSMEKGCVCDFCMLNIRDVN